MTTTTLPTTTEISMNTTTNPTTTELSMNESTMPYHWTMCHIKSYCWNRGSHFFSPDTMRFFKSRIQSNPPYKGRVFVTSERMNWNSPRYYTVRVVEPSGNIRTIGEFQGFGTRQSAHRFAEKYAAENFERVGNESVCLAVENKNA